jgi:DTW domain-containing protein YfiP
MRPTCSKCEYILERCLCDHLCDLTSPISIIVLRDPKEKKHALGTAKLLQLCLKNLTVIDTDEPDNCEDFINLLSKFKNPILLYPFEFSILLTSSANSHKAIDCMIFLDGTWKKTNRLYFRSNQLQTIPRYHLDLNNVKTNYRLRKSSKENSLSTIEAVELALTTVYQTDFSELIRTFEIFIDKQIELMNKKKGV